MSAGLKISVVMCCLDAEDTLEAACRSVSFADEIVVVDSGSTDRTEAIVDSRTCSARSAVLHADRRPGFLVAHQPAAMVHLQHAALWAAEQGTLSHRQAPEV